MHAFRRDGWGMRLRQRDGRLDRIIRESVWPFVPEPIRRQIRRFVAASRVLLKVVRGNLWASVPETIRRQIRLAATRRALGIVPFGPIDTLQQLEQRYQQLIAGTAATMPGLEIELSTPEHADEMVARALLLQKNYGYPYLTAYISSFTYRFPNPPSDPFSMDYRNFWMAQYEALARKSYVIENEHHNFDLASLRVTPHPYNLRDQKVIAAHVIASGTILEAIVAPPPAKVLEMGVGFGNTALQMGLSGYDVTVLDIEKKHLEIVAERFGREGLAVRCLHMQFLDIAKLDERFDAIVFYECFHHCLDHHRLLSILREKLTARGVIIFAGETINEILPYAWGLNPTGQGVWSVRHHGWMELVFKESYFVQLMEWAGFSVSQNLNPHSAHSWVFTARFKDEVSQ